ncbi:NUDIX domain-containing protein [Yinghuangia soli]|uniref:NUDIX domain-containing protein n=1 Tax=Yinghuangia soli TaxID=2908204 RepID=A0AA41Q2U9_9ACTN|nr:NUDIX domain-containing protein [Yinghuangia soli]MCF2530197.1 NUDIX domain-containing protein [Yinghuangia soli]
MSESVAEFVSTARKRLAAFRHIAVPDTPGMRRAAVVLCIAEFGGRPQVVVIKRAYRGRNPGQWGLPGGRLDAGETPLQAGLRELHEELGLELAEDAVLGRLDDFPAASGFAITPIVAAVDGPVVLTPNHEIHTVHTVGLDRLAAPDTPRWVPQPGGPPLLQMHLAPDMLLHAPTGALLWQFREVVLLDHPDARAADFAQPDWTRH